MDLQKDGRFKLQLPLRHSKATNAGRPYLLRTVGTLGFLIRVPIKGSIRGTIRDLSGYYRFLH